MLLAVYDVTEADSLAALETMVAYVRIKRPDMPIIVVGNKAGELEQVAPIQNGPDLAETLGAFFVETSARTGKGIARLEDLILDILEDPNFDPPCQPWLPELVLTFHAQKDQSERICMTFNSMSGNVAAELRLDQMISFDCLRKTLAAKVGLPRTRVRIVLPNGKLMQASTSPWNW